MMKINKDELLNEKLIECICFYDSKPLNRLVRTARNEDRCREFRGKFGIKSMMILTDGGIFLCPYLPSTYYERGSKELYLQVHTDIYLRNDEIREIVSKLNTQQHREVGMAKKNESYINLCGRKKVSYYVFMNSGRIYGVAGIKERID